LSRFVASVTRISNVCSMIICRTSFFWRNLATPTERQSRWRLRTRERGGDAPERADHLEHDYGAGADLANVVAGEEGFGAVEQLWPFVRKVIRDERLERARELDRDRARRGRGKEREDVALQGQAVSRQDRLVIRACARRLDAIGRCDAIFDPHGDSLACSAAR
jgi:hypothetical protein